jgi:hypothetical protein
MPGGITRAAQQKLAYKKPLCAIELITRPAPNSSNSTTSRSGFFFMATPVTISNKRTWKHFLKILLRHFAKRLNYMSTYFALQAFFLNKAGYLAHKLHLG